MCDDDVRCSQALNGRLYEKQETVERLAERADTLVTQGYMARDDPRVTQTETLSKQHARLGEQPKRKEKRLRMEFHSVLSHSTSAVFPTDASSISGLFQSSPL